MDKQEKKKPRDNNTERARRFFETSTSEIAKANPSNRYLTCKLCKTDIKGTHSSNIVPHLKRMHKEEYDSHIAIKSEEHIEISRLKLIQSCVEIVSVNGKPFTTLSCSGFVNSHQSTLKKLKAAGRSINLKDTHLSEVKEHLHSMATKVREKMKLEMRGKLLSLMIDGATRNNRSLLGISVQYIVNGCMKVVMLGIKEIVERSTAMNLCFIVKTTLEEYEIPIRSIISVTTDNAANMIATTQELECELNRSIAGDISSEDLGNAELARDQGDVSLRVDGISDTSIDDEIQDSLNEPDATDEDALHSIFDEGALHDDLLRSVGNSLNREFNPDRLIDDVRCAIHTIQLAVKDAPSSLNRADSNVISLCRNIAKFLRLKSTQIEMRHNDTSILPILDVETRWNSSYALVNIVNTRSNLQLNSE